MKTILLFVVSFLSYAQTPFLPSIPTNRLRNDFAGFVGMSLTVGANPITVTSLGRICISGNTGTHIVKLADSTGADVVGGSASISMAGCAAGQFKYSQLATPVTLFPTKNYYLVSQESIGGDNWYEFSVMPPTTVATINNAVWSSGNSYAALNFANTAYVTPNFLYGASVITSGIQYDPATFIVDNSTTPPTLRVIPQSSYGNVRRQVLQPPEGTTAYPIADETFLPDTVHVYQNGLLLAIDIDYKISGMVINMTDFHGPTVTGDIIQIEYRYQ